MSRLHYDTTSTTGHVIDATDSTSSTTGAAVITTGCGIGGNLFCGGDQVIENYGTLTVPGCYQGSIFSDPTSLQTTLINTGNVATNKWRGGVLAPNGLIYFVPFNATTVGVLNPLTHTFTTFGNISGASNAFQGGVLSTNGNIYCIPTDYTKILKIDPRTNTISFITSAILSTPNWRGGVLARNGKIYCMPRTHTQVLIIDPSTDTLSVIGNISGIANYFGGVLGKNGKIYGVPDNQSNILEVDPVTDTVSLIPLGFSTVSGDQWRSGTLAPNGKLYFASSTNFTKVLVYDTDAFTYTLIGGATIATGWECATLAPNGKIYCIPFAASNILEINPLTNTVSYIGSFGATPVWRSGVLAPNGKIYGVPGSNSQILVLSTGVGSVVDIGHCLSAYLNKF